MYGPVERDVLYRAFLPMVDGEIGSRTNFDDALTFLFSGGVITKNDSGKFVAIGGNISFNVLLLLNMRNLQLGRQDPSHPMDPWYLGLIESLFIIPNLPLVFRLHQLANSLDIPEILSEEKINAWKRVLEFLGLGNRLSTGFLCCFKPELIWDIICLWEEDQGPVQLFLDKHFSNFLPWENEKGDIAQSLRIPLMILAREGYIQFEQKQDLPNKCYLGNENIKWIRKVVSSECCRVSKKIV